MRITPLPFLAIALLLTPGCKQDQEIKVYRLAKESTPAVQPSAPADHNHSPAASGAGALPAAPAGDPHAGLSADQLAAMGSASAFQVTDTAPAHWKKQPATAMRQASYLVEGSQGASADVSLIILRGAGGGTLDNVNRWREQLGQKPIDEATLKSTSQPITTPVGSGVVVDIEGLPTGGDAAKDGRIVGVIATQGADAWFYKMRGNAALAAEQKEPFIKWVQTVKQAAGAPAPAAAQAAPAGATPAAPAPAPKVEELTWTVPSGWVLAPAASSMRYATFTIASADGAKGEMAVTHFPGDVGGDLENVNRWRQQVGLGPVDQAGLAGLVAKITAGPKTLSIIDVTGAQSRLAAAWTRHGSDTWFFKFTGPEALVGAEKVKFTSLLESVRFTQPE